jgi:hypothetical protein
MVHTNELSALKITRKVAETSETEPVSAVSAVSTDYTDYSSDCSSSALFEKDRKHERNVRNADRFAFCLNVVNIIVCSVLLTKEPQYYVYWNAIIVPALILHRVFDYYSKGWHFYMIDFCYWVNLVIITSTVFFPQSEVLNLLSFSLAFGPLMLAIYFFRNTLALTSMDKITSLFIHNQGPLTMFLVRYHDRSGLFAPAVNGVSEFGIPFLSKWYGSILIFYGIWAVIYCTLIFLVFGKHINRRKLETLYSYSMADPKKSKKLLSRGPKWSKMLFMFHHCRMVLIFSTLAVLCYYNYWVCLLWIVGNHAVAIYNGATYTIDFHSSRYERQFLKGKRL